MTTTLCATSHVRFFGGRRHSHPDPGDRGKFIGLKRRYDMIGALLS